MAYVRPVMLFFTNAATCGSNLGPVSYRHDGLEERIHSIDILGGNIQLFLAKLEKKKLGFAFGESKHLKKKEKLQDSPRFVDFTKENVKFSSSPKRHRGRTQLMASSIPTKHPTPPGIRDGSDGSDGSDGMLMGISDECLFSTLKTNWRLVNWFNSLID